MSDIYSIVVEGFTEVVTHCDERVSVLLVHGTAKYSNRPRGLPDILGMFHWDQFKSGDVQIGYLTLNTSFGLLELQVIATGERAAWSWLFASGRHWGVRVGEA